MYRCTICGKTYRKGRAIGHVLKHHIPFDQVPFACSLCNFRCLEARELAHHVAHYDRHQREVSSTGVSDPNSILYRSSQPIDIDQYIQVVKEPPSATVSTASLPSAGEPVPAWLAALIQSTPEATRPIPEPYDPEFPELLRTPAVVPRQPVATPPSPMMQLRLNEASTQMAAPAADHRSSVMPVPESSRVIILNGRDQTLLGGLSTAQMPGGPVNSNSQLNPGCLQQTASFQAIQPAYASAPVSVSINPGVTMMQPSVAPAVQATTHTTANQIAAWGQTMHQTPQSTAMFQPISQDVYGAFTQPVAPKPTQMPVATLSTPSTPRPASVASSGSSASTPLHDEVYLNLRRQLQATAASAAGVVGSQAPIPSATTTSQVTPVQPAQGPASNAEAPPASAQITAVVSTGEHTPRPTPPAGASSPLGTPSSTPRQDEASQDEAPQDEAPQDEALQDEALEIHTDEADPLLREIDHQGREADAGPAKYVQEFVEKLKESTITLNNAMDRGKEQSLQVAKDNRKELRQVNQTLNMILMELQTVSRHVTAMRWQRPRPRTPPRSRSRSVKRMKSTVKRVNKK